MVRFRENVAEADWLHLTEDENVQWTGRPSRFTLVRSFAIAASLVLIGVGLAIWARSLVESQGWPLAVAYAPLLLAVGGILYGIFTYLEWLRLVYVITDEEVYVKIGLLSRDVTQIPFARLQNTSYDQSILERILSYGDIEIYTAGTETEDVVLESVPNPERVCEALTTQFRDQHESSGQTTDGL